MRAADTNVLVRLLADDNEEQTEAAHRLLAGGVWVSVLALAEAIWVLASAYEFTKSQQIRAVEMFMNHQDVTLDSPETVAAALHQFRLKPSLSFSDCLVLELARRAGHLPLVTFDKKLARMEGVERLSTNYFG